jgi:hypothetical protein
MGIMGMGTDTYFCTWYHTCTHTRQTHTRRAGFVTENHVRFYFIISFSLFHYLFSTTTSHHHYRHGDMMTYPHNNNSDNNHNPNNDHHHYLGNLDTTIFTRRPQLLPSLHNTITSLREDEQGTGLEKQGMFFFRFY